LAENEAASQAASAHLMKSYASENDLFLFSALWIVTRKTGNTGAEKLYGRANIPSYSIHALYKPLHGDLMKSYAIAKTNIIASDNKLGEGSDKNECG
jgi:hypothetical protein